ncbi:thioredoxin domain-containing protein [Candidatus Gottesmanbacteria bacterium]|nr:thioredoxin domain-containing protein [Candidatus Gottesmanbacteria bacterium]
MATAGTVVFGDMKLTGESKFLLGIIVATIVLIGGAIILFSRPAGPLQALAREELIPTGTYTKGNASASAYLVEFSDFQCPACKDFQPVVDELVTQHQDNLLFVYRHFPLDQHEFAVPAAIAAEAAGRQEKFWEMYALLFTNQEKFSAILWSELAKQVGLDLTQFEAATSDPSVAEKITADRAYGLKIGVTSTPTFYLNGIKLTLTSYDDLRRAVKNAL